MSSARHKILISGGGIAGLTAALCLAKTGNRVFIFEQAMKLDALGAGIQISPNAFHVLKSLGLAAALIKYADMPRAIIMMNAHNGKQLAELPLGQTIEQQYDAPYLVIHRADLQDILLKACEANPDISIQYSTKIVDAAIHPNGVTALTNTNDRINENVGDLIVGADGIHSSVRSAILNLPPATYSGKTAWRALIPAYQLQDKNALHTTTVWLGSKAHAVSYPVRKGEFLNVIAVTQEADAKNSRQISKSEINKKFSHWNDAFTKTLKCNVDWTGWPLYEMREIDKMSGEKVALIGDAAHAMLPFAAQGAAQAIEDAYVLSQCILTQNNIEDALSTFEKERLPRVRKVVNTARTNGKIYHLPGIMGAIRNMGLKQIPGDRLLQKQDWIYRWKP